MAPRHDSPLDLSLMHEDPSIQRQGEPYRRTKTGPSYETAAQSTFAHKKGKKTSRMKSNLESSSNNASFHNPKSFIDRIWNEIHKSLIYQNLDTEFIWKETYDFLFPIAPSREDIDILEQLRREPLIVSNDDLAKIMDLEISDVNSPPTKNGHHFYIRSFSLTGVQVKSVVAFMADGHGMLRETDSWLDAVALNDRAGKQCTFTIRYVGTCEGPKTPFQRLKEDMLRKSGIFVEFIHALEAILPEALDSAQCHMINKASLVIHERDQVGADDHERVLIEYFQHKSLLNRQRGGKYVSYEPDMVDQAGFEALHTDLYHTLRQKASLPVVTRSLITSNTSVAEETTIMSDICDHFDMVQAFANDYPLDTGTQNHPFTDGIKNAAIRAAKPTLYHNTTLMALFAKDITLEDYLAECSFWETEGQGPRFTLDILARLAQVEAHNHKRARLPRRFDPWHVPVIDLYCSPAHRRYLERMAHARAYFAITKPLIIASASVLTTSISRANFRHDNGLDLTTNISSITGDMSIQYYTEPNSTGDVNEDDAFILIPHLDPGRWKYSGAGMDIELCRVLDLVWQFTIHVMDEATKYLDKLVELGLTQTRLQICTGIIGEVERLSRTSLPHMNFLRRLHKARDNLINKTKDLYVRAEYENTRSLLNPNAASKIAALGIADGAPHSHERRQQLENLWIDNIADLHLSVSHDEAKKQIWMDGFLNMAENQFLFLNVIAQMPEHEHLNALIERFRPEWRGNDGDGWLKSPDDVARAVVTCGLWVAKELPPGRIKSHAVAPGLHIKTKDMQGAYVAINVSMALRIRWEIAPGNRTAFSLQGFAKLMPKFSSETRSLSFTEYGIDVIDAGGNAFRQFDDDKATFPLVQFYRAKNTKESHIQGLKLWEAVRKHNGFDPTPQEIVGRDWGNKQGLAAIPYNASDVRQRKDKSKVVAQNNPPHDIDANFLLVAWLDRILPNGGQIHLNANRPPTECPELLEFMNMIESPEYARHPFAAFWKAVLQKPEQTVPGLLGKNIKEYRLYKLSAIDSQLMNPNATTQVASSSTTAPVASSSVVTPASSNAGTKASGRAKISVLQIGPANGGHGDMPEDVEDFFPNGSIDGVWPAGRGLTFTLKITGVTKPAQHFPPHTHDALYPLYVFVNRILGDEGGRFWRNTSPDGINHIDQFRQFLSEPAYCKHPYTGAWLNDILPVPMTEPHFKKFGSCMAVYRTCERKSQQVRRVPHVYYVVGPKHSSQYWPSLDEPAASVAVRASENVVEELDIAETTSSKSRSIMPKTGGSTSRMGTDSETQRARHGIVSGSPPPADPHRRTSTSSHVREDAEFGDSANMNYPPRNRASYREAMRAFESSASAAMPSLLSAVSEEESDSLIDSSSVSVVSTDKKETGTVTTASKGKGKATSHGADSSNSPKETDTVTAASKGKRKATSQAADSSNSSEETNEKSTLSKSQKMRQRKKRREGK